jgi:hypothetical protein
LLLIGYSPFLRVAEKANAPAAKMKALAYLRHLFSFILITYWLVFGYPFKTVITLLSVKYTKNPESQALHGAFSFWKNENAII